MLDVSWGELGILTGVALFAIGRKDLPSAARVVGTQVGRVVGLLQGARARADAYAATNELKQLQNQLQAGLRELDAVRSELAVSMSYGRTLGATVPGANRAIAAGTSVPTAATTSAIASSGAFPHPSLKQAPDTPTVETATTTTPENVLSPPQFTITPPLESDAQTTTVRRELPPLSRTVAAVAQQEWDKGAQQFVSQAEQGRGVQRVDVEQSGSVVLSKLLRESLVHDQYDRVVREQDDALQSKVESIQQRLEQEQVSR